MVRACFSKHAANPRGIIGADGFWKGQQAC